MSRLLHAAARGARIQYRSPVDHKWKANFFLPNFLNDSLYRIHPDDEHLAYGPISTALRDCDGDFQWVQIDWSEMPDLAIRSAIVANYAYNMIDEWRQNKDRLTRSLFLLILAEALADEGM
jgi:hypothetical protein